jgi:hypothetical protein
VNFESFVECIWSRKESRNIVGNVKKIPKFQNRETLKYFKKCHNRKKKFKKIFGTIRSILLM